MLCISESRKSDCVCISSRTSFTAVLHFSATPPDRDAAAAATDTRRASTIPIFPCSCSTLVSLQDAVRSISPKSFSRTWLSNSCTRSPSFATVSFIMSSTHFLLARSSDLDTLFSSSICIRSAFILSDDIAASCSISRDERPLKVAASSDDEVDEAGTTDPCAPPPPVPRLISVSVPKFMDMGILIAESTGAPGSATPMSATDASSTALPITIR